MRRARAILFLLLTLAGSARAINEVLWLTDAGNQDSLTVRVGETFEVRVWVNTSATTISGFQCFLHTPEGLAESVPYQEAPLGWFADNHIFGADGSVLFADNHDLRFPDNPLPGSQLDWCVQTRIDDPRPVFAVYGVACTFRLRFLQPVEDFYLAFDHDNNNFRNTLFWEGQSALEHPFYREYGLHIKVVGMEFGPLPDLTLTTPAPCDSLDLSAYLSGLDSVDPDSVWYSWRSLGPNATCTLDSLRLPGAFWLRACALGPDRQVDLEVTAHALNLAAPDTLRVLRGDPPVIDEGMGSADPFVMWLEDGETFVDFDDWVSDLDDPVGDLTWSLVPGAYHVSLEIDNVLRRGRFSAPPDWTGWDTLFVRVSDPGAMADTSRLVTRVIPVNDAPEIAFAPLTQVHPGQPLALDLEALSSDVDNSYEELWWTVAGDTSQVAARLDPLARTLTLEVRPGTPLWIFADFTVRVTDLEGLWDEDLLHVQVASYPPLWEPIGEFLIPSGGSLQIDLDEYVADQDNADGELTLSLLGMNHVSAVVDPASHVATLQAPSAWAGLEELRAVARDPDGNTDTDTLLVVALQGGNPLVARAPDLVFLPGAVDSLELDPLVWDLDTPDTQITWTVENSGLFITQVRSATRRVVYTAPALPGSVDQSSYRATDPQGHWGEDTGSLAVIDPSGRPVIFPLGELWMRVNSVDSSLALDQLVYDYDDEPGDLSWQVGAGSLVAASVRAADHRLILQSAFAHGTESLQLTVEDPAHQTDSGLLVVHVTEGNPPIVSAFAPRFLIAGQTDTLAHLSSWVYDPDPGDRVDWSFVDPPGSLAHAVWDAAHDRALIFSDPLETGLVQVGAVATDQARNSDLAWISLRLLENRPPALELGLLANPGESRLLDLVVLSDEPLRSLTATRDGDGATLAFSEMAVPNPAVRLYRADLLAPEGSETWHLRAVDLPGYPQVAGNVTLDSLVIGSGVLGRPGDHLPAPDGALALEWSGGLSNGRWVIRQEGPAGARRWRLLGPAGGRARAQALAAELERMSADGWEPLAAGPAGEVRDGDLLRLADGDEAPEQPAGFRLLPAVPNPFNPATLLHLELERAGAASLEIVDLRGRRVRLVDAGVWPAGARALRWDGRGDDGLPAASGVYFARLRQGERQAAQKLVLLK